MKSIVARDMHYKTLEPFVHLYVMIMIELVIHNQNYIIKEKKKQFLYLNKEISLQHILDFTIGLYDYVLVKKDICD